jgi:ABC-type multidrug transport system permease subunit
VKNLPPWWLWMQVVLVVFVVIGIVIAIVQLATT